MQLVQTVAPSTEPITLDEAKSFMRILENDDDLIIGSLISSSREYVENVTNRQLVSAIFELYCDDFISKLPKNPIISVDKIEYLNNDGSYIELDITSYYLYERNGIGFISYSSIPSLLDHKKAVKITFKAGYESVPEAIKSYIKVRVSTLYENRETYVIGTSISSFDNKFVENMLSPYKVRPIA